MALNQNQQTIPATGTVRLPAANFFFLLTASANVSVTLSVGGQTEIFSSTIAGLKLKRLKRWDYIDVAGAAGTLLNYLIGYTAVQADDTDIQQALATIAGTVAVATLPSTTISDTPNVALPNAATTQIVPINLFRRRVTIGNPSTALASFFLRSAAGANNLLEVQPGTFVEVDTTARIDGRNDSGAALSATVFEES